MSSQFLLTLVVVFVSVALFVGVIASDITARMLPGRRRLSQVVRGPDVQSVFIETPAALAEAHAPFWDRLADALPTSRGSVKRLRRELALAGFHGPATAALVSLAELVLPVLFAIPPFLMLAGTHRWMGVGVGVALGYMAPGFLLRVRLKRRQKEIENGLADALDLFVLCLEAGSSLDQAIVKASEELEVAYPALGDQLRILITETRAGKARLDAFRGLAARTGVDDVRALVAMLVQTDRFGTSIAQALRTHAEVCRTKRRQRAEERAQKVGVKLVFPLVFFLFPALYVVLLGPAFLEFSRAFSQMNVK